MKKLLTLLGSVSLVATTAQMAVACGTNYDKKDKDGNSILIQFLQSINGKAKISTNDILVKLINAENGPKNKEKLTLDLLKMINLSILTNSESNKDLINDKNIYTNYDLAKILKERWNALNDAFDRQISSEKDKYKKDHGKKWEKEWNKMLVNKYSIYQDDVKSMDKDFLENKYKSNILLSDANNNASKTLLDILINTDQMGVTWISSNDIVKKYTALERIVKASDASDSSIANYLRTDLDQLSQIKNSTQDNTNNWEETKITSSMSDIELANKAKEIIKIDKNKITNDAPVNLNNFTVSDTNNSRAGFLSNSQRFFLDKWYNTQAPLAISEVVIPFSEGGSFDKGFTQNSFKSKDKQDETKSNRLLTAAIDTNFGDASWNRWMIAGKADFREDATVKHYDKLMTLSNSTFTQDMRTAVYDYVLSYSDNKNGIKLEATPSIETLIDQISRKKGTDKSFYAYNDKGQIFYVDTSGLHIVKIDKYELLIKDDKYKKGYKQEGLDGTKINSNTTKELNKFKNFNKLKPEQKVEELQNISNEEKNKEGSYYKSLNSTVKNNYLHYLVNTSMLKGLSGSASSFDIMTEVKEWAQVSSAASDSSNTYWMACVFDYFFEISKGTEKNLSQEKFIQNYVEFGKSDDETTQEIINKTKEWFDSQVKTKQSWIWQSSSRAFYNANNKWADDIEAKTDASGYPKKTIKNTWYDGEIVAKVENKFWIPTNNNLIYINIENSYYFYKKGGI
ncbi:lipoprotein [Spiroplasma endosymbiont of Atherix ibis]|uniref:lipoprotein n=1 Tax=Spiroplasma endosymbiont of Atherix ibis TaxID=3066291 RepID=UPI0030D501A4